MKQIIKLAEPNSLTQHRANQPAFYHNLPLKAKNDIRKNLLLEQGSICCYCTKRIPEKMESNGTVSYEMKIEHYMCQENHPKLQLTYSNLFGACMGNEGKPKRLQTCDTKKGYSNLTISLTSSTPSCETLFRYNPEGEMSSIDDNEDINRQLNDILNLNMQSLKDARRQVYLEVQKRVESESRQVNDRKLKVKYFEQERIKWLTKNNDEYRPFCLVAVYYLNKKIRQYQS